MKERQKQKLRERKIETSGKRQLASKSQIDTKSEIRSVGGKTVTLVLSKASQ